MQENRLLLVDDDELFLSRMQNALARKGFIVSTATNTRQALSVSSEQQPHTILLDLKLGNESGLGAIPKLLLANPEVHIIMLTGYGSISTAVQAIQLGAIDYLVKPVDTAMIIQALNSQAAEPTNETESPEPHTTKLKRMEWEHIQQTLVQNDGNISKTARELGMHRKTLQRKLSKKPIKE